MHDAQSETHSKPINPEHKRAQHGRDYTIYTRFMDAALEAKAKSIMNHFGEVPEGAVIMDIGSGTGQLTELIARAYRNQHVRVYAVDASHDLLEIADSNRSFMNLLFDDATELTSVPENFADIMFHGTIGHEINSFYGTEGLKKALRAALRGLKPDGLEVWRDFAKPAITGSVLLRIDAQDGFHDPQKAMVDGFLDYSKLSTRALFDRFHQEFLGGSAFEYRKRVVDGVEYIELPARFAHEFCLRKDYTANWRQEIKEEYLYWDPSEAKKAFEEAGFDDVTVVPDDNEYIRNQRLRGKIALFTEDEEGLHEVELLTHMVVTARKPDGKAKNTTVPLEAVDYDRLLDTIHIDEDAGTVTIGDKVFHTTELLGMGAHKRVYMLDDGKHVLKVVRSDRPNTHNVFKSMQQMIDRQHIIEEHGVKHMRITEKDSDGPPYRYVIQERIPEEAECAAGLVSDGNLTEGDIAQIAGIVNAFELERHWQLDTNPFNWYRVINQDGSTSMVYVGGTVYKYDELWEFKRVGLLQWTDEQFIKTGEYSSSAIPKAKEADDYAASWGSLSSPIILLWKKYLSKAVQP